MVRLINKDNIKYVTNVICFLMGIQDKMTHIAEYNNPGIEPCIYAMWHGNQFCIHGIPNRNKLNVLISTSFDGNIVAGACEFFGYKVRRGSANRKGAISSSIKMLECLKSGENVAIMPDGPRGPLHDVKRGAIVLAKEAKVPIVPVHWYSDNFTFIRLKSWDKMTTPLGPCWLLNTYGDPIYTDGKTEEQIAEEIKQSLLKLEQEAPEKYKEAKEQKLWKKQSR
jgi:lysophospholipid acyltransferase (LPLAT)-like uncharacterized protein